MKTSEAGMTLIELLMVIVILGVMSGMVMSLTANFDNQSRYEESTKRLGEIRFAILGPDAVAPDGSVLTGGYLQDMGWMPDKAADLLRPPQIELAGGSSIDMPPLRYDETWKTWYGWRGPYLAAHSIRKGDAAKGLYDGWGNDFYGWPSESEADPAWKRLDFGADMALRMKGSDGEADGDGGDTVDVFARDYPAADQPLISGADWTARLTNLEVRIVNYSSIDFSVSPIAVRMRIVVPRWDRFDPAATELDKGVLSHWPATPFVGDEFILSLGKDENTRETLATFWSTTPDPDPVQIPRGRRALFLVKSATGEPLSVQAYTQIFLSRKVSPDPVIYLRDP